MFLNKIRTFTGIGLKVLEAKLLRKRIPIFLSLFITNRCNLRCKYCFVVDEKIDKEILNSDYSKEEAFDIVDEFYAMGTKMIYILGGEPLVHKDIGEIIDYITRKGIYLHVITNGLLIKRKLKELANVHALCVSLDGLDDKNDDLRGDGSFDKAREGIITAVGAGIPTRVHSVLTRRNLDHIRQLAEFCGELGVPLTISPPNFLGKTDMADLRITKEEYKKFWKEYLQMKREGLPIGNIEKAIVKCAEWPIDYHTYIKPGENFDDYKPVFCLNGYTYVALGAEGTMYNCINRGCLNGPNIKEIGIKKAWEKLLEWRTDCVSCSSINCIETAMMLDLDIQSLVSGWKFHK